MIFLRRVLLLSGAQALAVWAMAIAPDPGAIAFGTEKYVEYDAGDLPLVITTPHGGRLRPESLPNRVDGVTGSDLDTLELARAIAGEFATRTGHRVHLVASHLHRSKLDPNREITEAAQGNAAAERAWREYHAFITEATAAAAARHGFAFLLDLHGHGHPIPRIELGYTLSQDQLGQSDAAFDASGLIARSTLRDLHARLGGSAAQLLRGQGSLGDLFAARGMRAVPSPEEPAPGESPFFAGAYTIQFHAAEPTTTKVDGVQIETYRQGLRDTAENRARFAAVVAEVFTVFLHERYRYDFPAANSSTANK